MADDKGIIFDGNFQEFLGDGPGMEMVNEVSDSENEEAGFELENVSSRIFDLARIRKWPETKTVFEVRKIAFGIKTKVPIVRFRECELRLQATVYHPSVDSLADSITKCLKEAIIQGVVATVLSGGNLGQGAIAIQSHLQACLIDKGTKESRKISVKLARNKKCGQWGSPRL
jgi:hypothetical protein